MLSFLPAFNVNDDTCSQLINHFPLMLLVLVLPPAIKQYMSVNGLSQPINQITLS
jgi:hypothetical protein